MAPKAELPSQPVAILEPRKPFLGQKGLFKPSLSKELINGRSGGSLTPANKPPGESFTTLYGDKVTSAYQEVNNPTLSKGSAIVNTFSGGNQPWDDVKDEYTD